MKTFSRILATLAAAALIAGCVDEEPAYNKGGTEGGGGGEKPTATEGYLTGIVSLRVIADTNTDTQPDDTADETKKPATQSLRTRADGEIDTNGYLVDILDAEGISQFEQPMTYAELQAQLAVEPLKLPVGTYTLEIRSEAKEAAQPVAWEHPVYGGSQTFSILKQQTTTVDEVLCTLQNIKVSLKYSKDLSDQLSAGTVTTISLGSASAEFPQGETRAAYFTPQAETNTLELNLAGTFVDGGNAKVHKLIENVKAGQWRKVTLAITYANEGNIKIGVQVESFIPDEEVTVNGSANLWEPVIDDTPDIDPTAPDITWPGHDLTQPFELTDQMFDSKGDCIEPFTFELESPNGIESFLVEVSSTNAAFVESLKTVLQLPTASFDLCALNAAHPAYTILKSFGFPLGDQVRGQQHTSFDIAGQMPLLYNDPGFDGTHTFSFTMTDRNGLSAEAALTLVVNRAAQSGQPQIVWRDHDIDRQYAVTADMQIDIDITVPAGIKAFNVTIDSETLKPFLDELELPTQFDLCHVEGDTATPGTLAFKLKNLGFYVNEEVLDQTSFDPPFSITSFVSLLLGIPGEHNFVLSITDNNDRTTTKTVQLKVGA